MKELPYEKLIYDMSNEATNSEIRNYALVILLNTWIDYKEIRETMLWHDNFLDGL